MAIQLIAKDKNEKIQYEGSCKLIINTISKLLSIEPFIEEFKIISALFNWEFVAQKNALFGFAEHDDQDFVLIFETRKKCRKIYKILMEKGANAGGFDLLQKRFLPEIFKEISENNFHSSLKLKEIFGSWMKHGRENNSIECIHKIENDNINDVVIPLKEENIRINPRKRKARNMSYKEVKVENVESDRDSSVSGDENSVSQNSTPECVSTTVFVEAPNFEVLKCFFNGHLITKVYVFAEVDGKKYFYAYSRQRHTFRCSPCSKQKNLCSAKIVIKDGKEVVQLNGNQHVCEPKEYKEIIEAPNFEFVSIDYGGKLSNKLIIFTDSSRTTCYEFAMKKLYKRTYRCCGCSAKKHLNTVSATIYERKDGTEIVMLNSGEHVCDVRKYNPEKYGVKETVEAANFNIVKVGNGQIKLIIFTSTEKVSIYQYFWRREKKNFVCSGCIYKRKHVSARVCQNSEGSNYLRLSNMKHVCNPQIYDPEKYEIVPELFNISGLNLNVSEMLPDEEVDPSNFRQFHLKQNGKSISRLIIFCLTNKNLCYEFYQSQQSPYFYCRYCPWNYNRVKAIVCKNEKNMEYLKVYGEHMCDLREFDEENFKDDIMVDKSAYSITEETLSNGWKSKFVSLFTPDTENRYYKYCYDPRRKWYFCRKCEKHKVYNTVYVENEGKEDECAYVSSRKHVCDGFNIIVEKLNYGKQKSPEIPKPKPAPKPLKIKEVKKPFTLAQNFKLLKNDKNGKIKDEMVIFTNEEESECYKYIWHQTRKLFICQSCYNKFRIYVNAKLTKTDDNKECVEMYENVKHQCEPIKYVSVAEKIINLPNFKLWEDNWGTNIMQKLAIIKSDNPQQGYIYSFYKSLNKFECLPCKKKKKSLTAKVLQNENGENYLQLNSTEHVCELQNI